MKILIATDGAKHSELACRQAAQLLQRHAPGRPDRNQVIVLTVSTGSHERSSRSVTRSLSEPSAAIAGLARSKKILEGLGITPKSVWLVGEDPAQLIVDTAEQEEADLIVLGCRSGHRFQGPLESVSDRVLRESRVPVLVIRERQAV